MASSLLQEDAEERSGSEAKLDLLEQQSGTEVKWCAADEQQWEADVADMKEKRLSSSSVPQRSSPRVSEGSAAALQDGRSSAQAARRVKSVPIDVRPNEESRPTWDASTLYQPPRKAATQSNSPVRNRRQLSRIQEVQDSLREALDEDTTPAFQGRTALLRWHVNRVEQMSNLVKEAALELHPASPTLCAGKKRLQKMKGLPLELFSSPPYRATSSPASEILPHSRVDVSLQEEELHVMEPM